MGHMFEANACIVRPFNDGRMDDEWCVQINQALALTVPRIDPDILKSMLAHRVW